MTDIPAIDQERIRAVCGGDEELAIELIGMLVDEATPLLEELERCTQAADARQMHEVAHSLKGIAGNVGAAELRAVAERLQTATEDGALPAPLALDAELSAIGAALERVRVTLAEWNARAGASIFA